MIPIKEIIELLKRPNRKTAKNYVDALEMKNLSSLNLVIGWLFGFMSGCIFMFIIIWISGLNG
jgi:hypothetical protein